MSTQKNRTSSQILDLMFKECRESNEKIQAKEPCRSSERLRNLIGELYDGIVSMQANGYKVDQILEFLEDQGIRIGRTTFYRYLKEERESRLSLQGGVPPASSNFSRNEVAKTRQVKREKRVAQEDKAHPFIAPSYEPDLISNSPKIISTETDSIRLTREETEQPKKSRFPTIEWDEHEI